MQSVIHVLLQNNSLSLFTHFVGGTLSAAHAKRMAWNFTSKDIEIPSQP